MITGWAKLGLETVFEWTWRTSLAASIVIVLVLTIQRVLGRWLSVQARFVLSSLVVWRLLLPVAPQSSWSLLNLAKRLRPAMATAAVGQMSPPEAASVSRQAEVVVVPSLPVTGEPARAPGRPRLSLSLLWALGVALALLAVLRQQRRVSQWVRAQTATADPALAGLLERCRAAMGVSRSVEVVLMNGKTGPALFGWRKPRLLLSKTALTALTESELRLVLLHELAHVRRHDILLNWLMILLQACHWFNPLVRLAMRRLRADRELVCDAMVLGRLKRGEERLYGQTLLKLLESGVAPQLSASAVPVVSTKEELKNRITMITLFKPSHPMAWAFTLSLALLVCCFTFTKAAGQAKTPAAVESLPNKTQIAPESEPPKAASAFQTLEEKLKQQDERVRAAEAKVDALRRSMAGDAAREPESDSDDVDTIRALEHERITTAARMSTYQALLKELEGQSKNQIRQMLPTIMPDELLRSLLERLSIAQTELARLSTQFGPGDVQMKAARAAIHDLNEQIDERVEGILGGLKAQVASHQATLSTLTDRVAAAKEQDAKWMERSRGYFSAKQELDTQRRIRETLMLRLLQEQIDAQLPKH
jgi:beta-lactamase regulating signal transducer with metallopeptidase domain